jgi:hypothetical protein
LNYQGAGVRAVERTNRPACDWHPYILSRANSFAELAVNAQPIVNLHIYIAAKEKRAGAGHFYAVALPLAKKFTASAGNLTGV